MLTWTSTKPTTPGWYWWRDAEENGPVIVQVFQPDKDAPLFVEHIGWLDDEIMGGDWAGPLEPPKEG